MNVSGRIETELIDTDVVYATGQDVFTHIRNKAWSDLADEPDPNASPGTNTSLTKSEVRDLIARFSDKVDFRTKRAWRRRRVTDYEVRVKFRHQEKRGRLRRRTRRGAGGIVTNAGRRGMGDLPHIHVVGIDAAEGDKVEVLNPREAVDITDKQGRGEGVYVVDERKGIIRPNVSVFVPVGRRRAGSRDIENARLRVSYRFGKDPVPETIDGVQVSTAVPGGIRDAVALLVAARLIGSDQYGELVPTSGGDSPSLAEAVSSWKSEANGTIKDFERP